MKYLVASDIHGSKNGVLRLFSAMEREHPDRVLLLGDLLHGGYTGEGSEVASMLQSRAGLFLAVCGNCDDPSLDEGALGFPLPQARAIAVGMRTMHLSHKPPYVHFPAGDMVLYGHTHCKTLFVEEGVLHFNPGSISYPRDGKASYGVIEGRRFSLHDAESGEELQFLDF